ncbi:sensory neuron membrane protein 1-like [Copidosoma floridanum]|uniref:sensory neuron membrane protein 1-like n=1 Tax=Copidosoma floridanum TaxID=29053 RepID=UPI0006C99C85|nr:sensory neuron membrane protein 1-like [Copidosoma floridanum]
MRKDYRKKFLFIGIGLFVFSFVFRYIILPPVVKSQVKAKVELRPGKFMRKIWSTFPFSLDFSVYLFNVTNPDEITQGAKPIVHEVGPFVYDEWIEKTDQIDHDDDDSVSFTFKYTYYFNAEKSKGLTGEEELIVPNYFILGLVNTIKLEKPAIMPAAAKGINSIFKNPSNIFMKQKAKDILFEGFVVDCRVTDVPGAAVCTEVRNQYEDLRLIKLEENVYLMSLFGATNGTSSKARMRVYRGKKHLMSVGQVIEYDGKPNISVWNDEVCDAFGNATDGTIFHPYYKKDDFLGLYTESMCRVISLNYLEDNKTAGISTYRYTTSVGIDPENNPHDKCYCMSEDKCLKKGAFDAYKCTKIPIVVTNPHFYLADPYYLSRVDGLSPNKDKHMLHLDIEPFAGAPVYAHSRAQLNMYLTKIEKFKLMKNMSEALLPLLWIDDALVLPKFMIKEIKFGLLQLKLATIWRFFLMFSGLGMIGFASFLHFKGHFMKKKLETTQPVETTNETLGSELNSADKMMQLQVGKLQPAPVPARID